MDFLHALQFSRYATRMLAAHARDGDWLAAAVDAPFDWEQEWAGVREALASDDAAGLSRAVRILRRRAYLHIMARDLSGRADLAEVCATVTTLAERTIGAAVELHTRDAIRRHGTPRRADGEAQTLIVVGMGKLGGGELNVSSDIDLVFLFAEDGETDGPRPLSHREFFERVGRRVIATLHDVTADGYVFRVDMRLRPYGESGPLALPLSAFEQYLITQGRAWERYAWLKARALTGEADAELAALITPFVFRKYLDFDAYDGLRDIHRQIRDQGKRRDYAINIKLGPGGIRELEFSIQALQLVRGGREPALRERGTLAALSAITERDLLPRSMSDALREAYRFLRNLEHRLQYRDDQQTQALPQDDVERQALAQAMAFADSAAFEHALGAHRDIVAAHFATVFGDPEDIHDRAIATAGPDTAQQFAALWREELTPDAAHTLLREAGYRDPEGLLATLHRVRRSGRYAQLPALSQARFDTLLPRLLEVAARMSGASADAHAVFIRLLSLLEAVSRRSAYLALIIEHPPLLPRITELMGASQWAADYLTRHPILLDELLDARALLAEPEWDGWRRELDRALAAHADDQERQMDVLRHFQHAQTFRLLAQDLAGTLSVERLADHLSALADIIIAAALQEVWKQVSGSALPPARFSVIGYGKLGGKELGYASDLDLVFVYDDPSDAGLELYTRVARRLITWLTSNTPAGPLYETDLRLRPDGTKGLVVSTFRAFWRYQREHAWTWEHQALTRARFVAGDAELGQRFEHERAVFLRLARDRDKLKAEVVDMRRRMHAGHPNNTALFDVKHDAGGMVDVEFAVQYLVLANAHEHAALTRNVGNIALLHMASELGLLGVGDAAAAATAYRHYRRRQHQLRLTGAPHARVDPRDEVEHRAAVAAVWNTVFGRPWRA